MLNMSREEYLKKLDIYAEETPALKELLVLSKKYEKQILEINDEMSQYRELLTYELDILERMVGSSKIEIIVDRLDKIRKEKSDLINDLADTIIKIGDIFEAIEKYRKEHSNLCF